MIQNKFILLNGFIALLMIIALYMVSKTLPSVLLFIPGVLISFLIILINGNHLSDWDGSILTWYLLALALQFIHFTEEYLTNFVVRLPAIFGQAPYPESYWICFNMIAYCIFLLGGIAIYKKENNFLIIPLFFIVVGIVFNGIAHVMLSVYTGGYFPGLYSAIIYLGMIPVFYKRMFN